MEQKSWDSTNLEQAVKALRRAKFEDFLGEEALALAQIIERLHNLKLRLDQYAVQKSKEAKEEEAASKAKAKEKKKVARKKRKKNAN